jgi:hypothetical protein
MDVGQLSELICAFRTDRVVVHIEHFQSGEVFESSYQQFNTFAPKLVAL